MGMSASQARYLSLVAQQSNLEYQGQQINQERSVLSQQVSDLYNSLLAMEVPTPPSTQEYTKVVYQGSIGATNYSFDASHVKPGSDGTYSVTLGTAEYGQSLQKNKGYAITEGGTEKVVGKTLTPTTTTTSTKKNGAYEIDQNYVVGTERTGEGPFVRNLGTTKPESLENVYIDADIDNNVETELVPATEENTENYTGKYYLLDDGSGEFDPNTCLPVSEDVTTTETTTETKLTQADVADLYIIEKDGTLTKATINDLIGPDENGHYKMQEGKEYFLKQAGGEETKYLPNVTGEENPYLIAGKTAYTLDQALALGEINSTQYNGYINAINNANLKSANGNQYTPDDFYLYIDDNHEVHFALKSDVQDGNGAAATYDYIPNGQFTKDVVHDNCKLTFDPSSGRIVSIEIPSTYNPDGTVASYTTMDLKAATETDELAYEEAMAQYEYKQYLYDREQQEINAKTEKIQAMDRNLELKLQRLDTQRTQITTEIEALEKVLNDNIESSYKTFSG